MTEYLGNSPNVWIFGKFPKGLDFWELSQMSGYLGNYLYLRNKLPLDSLRNLENFPDSWLFGEFPRYPGVWEILQIPRYLGNFLYFQALGNTQTSKIPIEI